MKVYKLLRNIHEDTEILQNDLNTLEQWSTEWQLKVLIQPSVKLLELKKKNDTSCPEYYLDGNKLDQVSETKDLGIYVTSNYFVIEPTGH